MYFGIATMYDMVRIEPVLSRMIQRARSNTRLHEERSISKLQYRYLICRGALKSLDKFFNQKNLTINFKMAAVLNSFSRVTLHWSGLQRLLVVNCMQLK